VRSQHLPIPNEVVDSAGPVALALRRAREVRETYLTVQPQKPAAPIASPSALVRMFMAWHRVKTKSPALRAPKSGPTVIVGQSMEGHSPFPPEYASALSW
jgi:hypothetical protein